MLLLIGSLLYYGVYFFREHTGCKDMPEWALGEYADDTNTHSICYYWKQHKKHPSYDYLNNWHKTQEENNKL